MPHGHKSGVLLELAKEILRGSLIVVVMESVFKQVSRHVQFDYDLINDKMLSDLWRWSVHDWSNDVSDCKDGMCAVTFD